MDESAEVGSGEPQLDDEMKSLEDDVIHYVFGDNYTAAFCDGVEVLTEVGKGRGETLFTMHFVKSVTLPVHAHTNTASPSETIREASENVEFERVRRIEASITAQRSVASEWIYAAVNTILSKSTEKEKFLSNVLMNMQLSDDDLEQFCVDLFKRVIPDVEKRKRYVSDLVVRLNLEQV